MAYRYKVFISYRRDDAVFKDTVYNILSEYIDEDRIFVDKKDLYNEPNEWAQSLDEALNSSEYIVICINKFTFVREPKDGKTDWYYKEIETALERQKAEGKTRIIPAINVRPEFDKTQFKELSKFQDVAYLSLGQDGFRKNLLKIVGIDVDTAQKKSASAPTIIKNITIPENLVTRRDMLDKLDNEFNSHQCVVISGIGGSGKTSLAYLYIKEQNFNNVAWVIVNGKIEEVFVDRIAGLLFKKEDYEGFTRIDDKQTKLDIIKTELSKIEGKNLLVFDINTNNEAIKQEIENQIHKYLPSTNWKTLILTRVFAENPTRFATIKMDKIAEDDAQKLFTNNWTRTKIDFSQDKLAEITKELYYHPLLIEQTAFVFNKGHEKTADEIITKIKENSKVNNPRTKKILSGLAIEDKEQQDIYTYLINLCNIENLSPDEINFLAVYVTWPEEPIDYEVIETLMPCTHIIASPIAKELIENSDNEETKQKVGNLSESKARQFIKLLYESVENEKEKQLFKEIIDICNDEDSQDTLDSLVEKGILSHNDSDQYIIHGLMADVLREQINIKEFDYTEYFDTIQKFLDDDMRKVTLHKYSKCIASSFVNYGLCNNILLFRKFHNQLCYVNDVILYHLPESEFTDIVKKLEENAEPFQVAELYNSVAAAENLRNNHFSAKSHCEKALEIMEGLEENEKTLGSKSVLLNNLANFEEKLGDINSAKKHYEKSLEIKRKLPETPQSLNSLATTLKNLAGLEVKLGDNNSAKKHYEKSLEITRKLPETPEYLDDLATILNYIAELEENLGDTDSAKKYYEEALEIKRELPETPLYLKELSATLNNLAMFEHNLGDTDSAKKHFEESLETYRKLPEIPPYLNGLATTLTNLATLENDLGNTVYAKQHYEDSLEIGRKLPKTPQNLYLLATTLWFYAILEENLGDTNSAKKHFEEGLEISRQIQNEGYINLFEERLNYCPVLRFKRN